MSCGFEADLIHLGAKYSPCMRDDTNVREAILSDVDIERNSSCCVLNDGSGCVQTVEQRCSVRQLCRNNNNNGNNNTKLI